jgi:formate hydrogenlyase transcriptional activator
MSSADRSESTNWLRSWSARYCFAVMAVILAALVRHGVVLRLGFPHPFAFCYPAILVVAFYAGFWPGIVSTLFGAAITDYFFMYPVHTFKLLDARGGASLVLFVAIGVLTSWAADLIRKHAARLQEFARAIEGLDEMIVVVDRDYRYLIANRAFVNYRQLEKKDILGRRIPEIIDPIAFESEVRPRLDECLQGKIVRFEMRYKYPKFGERELLISYFPIRGPQGIDRVACILKDITEQRKSERAVQLFRNLIDHSNDAVEVVDPETLRFLDVNETACRTLGYARSELLGMTVYEIDPNMNESICSQDLEMVHGGEPLLKETLQRRKDGSTFPVEISVKCVHLERDYLIAVSRDITERKAVERAQAEAALALRNSEERFRQLVEQASDGIFIADSNGHYIDVNTAGAEMLGYSREQILQLELRDLLIPEELERLRVEIARLVGGAVIRNEWTFRRKDGSVFLGEVLGKRLPDGRLQGIVRDVSERKRLEQELRQSEERFRVALKGSPVTVFTQDRDLRYTWIYNPQLYWQQESLGKTDAEILGQKKAAKLISPKEKVLRTGTPIREEVSISHDGKRHAFDITIEPILDPDGTVAGITGACMDIARLRALADSLQDDKHRLAREKSYLESEIETELGFETIIGKSSALLEVLRDARIVASTDSTVLILGETGTGKELIARSIHALGSRSQGTFVKLNCAAVPSGLLESELFGHEKGAFTGAVNQKVGRIELADKGTLFLDEIGELPLELQPKLLRVLQDREFERLGGVQTKRVDLRIMSATNRNLQQQVSDKKFREDLFYRLNVFPLHLPPMRERRDDIPLLAHHFVHKYASRMGKHDIEIPDEIMLVLQNWCWPGNIRELENVIERMVILTKGSILAKPPAELYSLAEAESVKDDLTQMEREHIIRILRETDGVLSGPDGAAVRLGIKRTTLQSMLKRFGIEAQEYRRGSSAFAND